MAKCSITQFGNDYAVSTPYDAKKSPLFNAMLKRYILPEYRTPQKEGNKFFWIIHPEAIQETLNQIEGIFGERPVLPELKPVDQETKYNFQLDYVGIPKEREGQTGKTALGFSKGSWRVIFSESILKEWFEQSQTSNQETLFSLLLLHESANDQEIKSGYRRLARQWHPDVCKEENAEEMFKKIQNAYSILSDENKRKRYLAGLEFERASAANSLMPQAAYPWQTGLKYANSFIPPLRCGFLTVTGSVQVGKLRVSQILSWLDVTNEQGLTMVTSWNKEAKAIDYQWV